jgi:hypothetical protein
VYEETETYAALNAVVLVDGVLEPGRRDAEAAGDLLPEGVAHCGRQLGGFTGTRGPEGRVYRR